MPIRPITLKLTLVHCTAASVALLFAWQISQTSYLQSGLQFIGPVAIILGLHFIYMWLCNELTVGFSDIIYRRATQTAVGMALLIAVADSVLPTPAQASDLGMQVFSVLFSVVFCGTIIVAVVAVFILAIRICIWGVKRIVAMITGENPTDGGSTRYDFGSLAVVAIVTLIASMEGLPQSFQFSTHGNGSASRSIAAHPSQVWSAMEHATSPDFPLPAIMRSFPKPIDVVVDEGVHLGAMREVQFQGREGAGCLTLKVVERTSTKVRFTVISDTTPYAAWVTFKTLTYDVAPEGDGARLDVSLEFDRGLAPAWFFTPLIKGVAHLSMDVLARDVKARSEAEIGAAG